MGEDVRSQAEAARREARTRRDEAQWTRRLVKRSLRRRRELVDEHVVRAARIQAFHVVQQTGLARRPDAAEIEELVAALLLEARAERG